MTMMVQAAVRVGGAGAMVLPALGIALGAGSAVLLAGWGLRRMLGR